MRFRKLQIIDCSVDEVTSYRGSGLKNREDK